jgi:hypothetical protein
MAADNNSAHHSKAQKKKNRFSMPVYKTWEDSEILADINSAQHAKKKRRVSMASVKGWVATYGDVLAPQRNAAFITLPCGG